MKKNLFFFGLTFSFLSINAQNVGIGTTTPAARLEVVSTVGKTAQFNGPNLMYIGLYENDIYRGYMGSFAGAAEDVDFGTGSTNNTGKVHLTIKAVPMLTIQPDGNVGIGTTSPTQKLEVDGNIRLRGSGALNQRLIFSNNANTSDMGSFGQFNDSVISMAYNTGGSQFSRFYFDVKNSKIGIGLIPNANDGKILVYYNSSTGNPHLTLRESGTTDYARLEFATGSFSRVWHIAGKTTTGTGTTGRENDLLNFWNSGWGDIMSLRGDGRVGIRTTTPATGYALSVDGKIICEELKVQLSGAWPDYVFDDSYQLTPIHQLQQQVMTQKHLPGIPAASQVSSENGFNMGDMQKRLLEKVEELYRYTFELNEKNTKLEAKIAELETQIKKGQQ